MAPLQYRLVCFVVGVLYTLVHDFTLAQDSSTTTLIGSNDTTPLLPFDTDGFYINTARPAVQNGTISSLNYCYYGRQDNSKNRYQSLVAVYRPTGVRGIYISISDTIIISKLTPALTVPQADTLIRGFNCDYYELQESVQVLKGDVIGACIYDTSNIGQLDLLSQTSEGYTLLVDSAHNADCDKGVLPSIIRGDSLEGTTRRGILHVSAEILTPTKMEYNNAGTSPLDAYTDGGFLTNFPTDVPITQGQPVNLFIIIMTVVGGLVFLAIVALIIVIIVVAYCLIVQKKRLCDQKECSFGITENTAYTLASRDTVTQNLNSRSSLHSYVQTSELSYDYIVSGIALTSRMPTHISSQCSECDETLPDNDSMLQENLAYGSHQKNNDSKSEKMLLPGGDYVICVK